MSTTRAQLKEWITKHSGRLGLPASTSQVSARGLLDYRALLEAIAKRAERAMPGHQILTGVTVKQVSGAWAYRDGMSPGVHVMVATQGLMSRIQVLAGASHDAALQVLRHPDAPEDFKALWGALPIDTAHAAGFARLLAHVAFVLLAHHELAHIVIGHGYFGASEGAVEPIEDAELLGLPAGLSAADLATIPEAVLRDQAFETDADMHALLWTDLYLRSFNPDSEYLERLDPATKAAHVSILPREDARRFVLIAASWVLFCALGGTQVTAKALVEGRHPPTGMRLAMMLFHEYDLASQHDPSAQRLDGAAAFGALILTHALETRPSLGEAIESIGYGAAMRDWTLLLAHHDRLAVLRKRYDVVLRPVRLEIALPEVVWWKPKPPAFR